MPDAPDRGRSAFGRTSVSALYTRPEVPSDDDFDALDRTIVARRKRIPWALIAPDGATVDLTSSVVILGRRPAGCHAADAQLVAIADETRTVSKTHARLELRGDTWYVTDLESTNGVLFATLMGTEVEAPPGEEIEAGSVSSSATRRCASRGGTRERPFRPPDDPDEVTLWAGRLRAWPANPPAPADDDATASTVADDLDDATVRSDAREPDDATVIARRADAVGPRRRSEVRRADAVEEPDDATVIARRAKADEEPDDAR